MTPQDGYRAIREGAAIGAIDVRVPIAVTGRDRASYLQGLLTNDIVALGPGTGCYALWLSPQGRTLTDLHVLESGEMVLLDVPAPEAAATLARLEQFIFTEDVAVASLADDLTSVWIHGPRAAAVLERAVDGAGGLAAWPLYRHARFESGGHPVSIARIDQLGVPGYCLFVERGHERQLAQTLETAGAVVVPSESVDAARIESGCPVFGLDVTAETIPLEAGLEDRAISFTKGCFVGQEVVIRVLHRGQGRVAKKLVRLEVDGPPPAAGATLWSGERRVGAVTSSASAPERGAIALGYVHREFLQPGTPLEVDTGSGRLGARVRES